MGEGCNPWAEGRAALGMDLSGAEAEPRLWEKAGGLFAAGCLRPSWGKGSGNPVSFFLGSVYLLRFSDLICLSGVHGGQLLQRWGVHKHMGSGTRLPGFKSWPCFIMAV